MNVKKTVIGSSPCRRRQIQFSRINSHFLSLVFQLSFPPFCEPPGWDVVLPVMPDEPFVDSFGCG
jgi:hypothetical protein